MKFCLSIFLKIIKETIVDSISNEDLINLLIGDMVEKESLCNKNGETFYIDKSATSRIMNNDIDVPKILRNSLGSKAASVECLEVYFDKMVIPKIIPENEENLCHDLYEHIIGKTPMSVQEKFEYYYNNGDIAGILAVAFRYSLVVSNLKERMKQNEEIIVKNEIRDYSKAKLFSDNKYTALGAVAIIGKWNEENRYDITFIEALTGLKYVDFAENIRVCENIELIQNNKICSVKSLHEIRECLIIEVYEKHIKLFFEKLTKVLLSTTEYTNLSDEMLNSVFDFIAYMGNNTYKCKRLNKSQWRNYIFDFAMKIFKSGSKQVVFSLISLYELFIETDPEIALFVISKQTEDKDSYFIQLLNEKDNAKISYPLSNAIRKSAALPNTFSTAMMMLYDLKDYNKIFIENMIYVMKTDYIQTKANLKQKFGIIKKLYRRDCNFAWNFVAFLLPGSNNTTLPYCDFRYLIVGTFGLSKEEYENEVGKYIEFLCENLTDSANQIDKMLEIMKTAPDNIAEKIVKSIKEHCISCKENEKIYENILRMANNSMYYSNDRIRLLDELRNLFQPAKETFEKKEIFSYGDIRSGKKTTMTDEDNCILAVIKAGGLKGVIDFACSVENMEMVIASIHRNLSNEDYFELLNEYFDDENHTIIIKLIGMMSDGEIIDYCKTVCPVDRRIDTLKMHAVSDTIIDYVDTFSKVETKNYWENVTYCGYNNLSENKYEYMIKRTVENQNYETSIRLIYLKAKNQIINFEQIYNILELYVFSDNENEVKKNHSISHIIQLMLIILQESQSADLDRIASLEEKYISLLSPYEQASPKCMYYKMANDPEYVKELIVKRNKYVEKDFSNLYLYMLFQNYRITPGTKIDGSLDYQKTRFWYDYAINVEDEIIQIEMLHIFGKGLFYANPDADGFIIDRRIVGFLEEQADKEVLISFEIEAFNSQYKFKISSQRSECDDIIAKYEQNVELCEEEGYIRVANIFRSIVENYKLEKECYYLQ